MASSMMFSSNQEFVVTGDNKESLKETLRFALILSGYGPQSNDMTAIKSFRSDPEKGELQFSCYAGEKWDGQDYLFPMSLTGLVEHIYIWLSSSEIREIYSDIMCHTGDGGTKDGWKLDRVCGSHYIMRKMVVVYQFRYMVAKT